MPGRVVTLGRSRGNEYFLHRCFGGTRGGKVGGILQLNGMKFESYGAYTISLLSNGEVVSSTTINVMKA